MNAVGMNTAGMNTGDMNTGDVNEADEPTARLLADLDRCLDQAAGDQRGALWRLAEPARQLDANLIRLPPGAEVPVHMEPDVDVLLLAVGGHGVLHTDTGPVELSTHTLAWLPHGSRRSITAGPDGLAYVTVHRARTGLRIRPPAGAQQAS